MAVFISHCFTYNCLYHDKDCVKQFSEPYSKVETGTPAKIVQKKIFTKASCMYLCFMYLFIFLPFLN